MSSELYVRWEIRNLENLHRQLKIQLEKERQRQAELLSEILEDISNITNRINAAKSYAGRTNSASCVKTEKISNVSDHETGEIVVSGISEDVENVRVESGSYGKRNLAVIDWSDQLDNFEAETSDKVRKHAYARKISAQLATAVLDSDEDIRAHNDFVTYLNGLLEDEGLDYEYFRKLVDQRFSALKQRIDMLEPEDVTEELFEYYALCELLGIKPQKISKEKLRDENRKLFEQYTEKKKEDYVYQNLMEVFEELNLNVVDEMELDGLPGQKVIDEALPDCSIFMSMDGSGIIFETVAEVEAPDSLSSSKKAMIEESARKVCQKHLTIIQKMQERGIYFTIECEEKPDAERIRKINKKHSGKIVTGRKHERYLER